jgi:hypothetical protein
MSKKAKKLLVSSYRVYRDNSLEGEFSTRKKAKAYIKSTGGDGSFEIVPKASVDLNALFALPCSEEDW